MAKLKGSAVEKILAKAGGVFGDKGFIGTDYMCPFTGCGEWVSGNGGQWR